MEDPEIIDIAPGGDVVFICTAGDGHSVRIRVLSLFVTTASSVLKAMLGPDFKEGNALMTTSVVEIALPEDDPATMILMFKAMHMRISSLPPSLDLASVKQLAATIDKYDCAVALAPITFYWIQGRIHSTTEIRELYQLFYVTYLLGQQELFGKVGARLVLEATVRIGAGDDQEGLAHAYDALEVKRLGIMLSISKFVNDQVTLAFRSCYQHQCLDQSKLGANLVNIIHDRGIYNLNVSGPRLGVALSGMRKITFGAMNKDCPGHSNGCVSRYTAALSEESFEARANKAEQAAQEPLCLKCLQAGDMQQKGCSHEGGLHSTG